MSADCPMYRQGFPLRAFRNILIPMTSLLLSLQFLFQDSLGATPPCPPHSAEISQGSSCFLMCCRLFLNSLSSFLFSCYRFPQNKKATRYLFAISYEPNITSALLKFSGRSAQEHSTLPHFPRVLIQTSDASLTEILVFYKNDLILTLRKRKLIALDLSGLR